MLYLSYMFHIFFSAFIVSVALFYIFWNTKYLFPIFNHYVWAVPASVYTFIFNVSRYNIGGLWHVFPIYPHRFFLMYLINKDETEHTGQVCWSLFTLMMLSKYGQSVQTYLPICSKLSHSEIYCITITSACSYDLLIPSTAMVMKMVYCITFSTKKEDVSIQVLSVPTDTYSILMIYLPVKTVDYTLWYCSQTSQVVVFAKGAIKYLSSCLLNFLLEYILNDISQKEGKKTTF